jgi:hypothetical protein
VLGVLGLHYSSIPSIEPLRTSVWHTDTVPETPSSNGRRIERRERGLAVWADRPRWAGSGFTRLVIELADLPGHPARLIARRHKAQLERSLAELLDRSGVQQSGELARAVWLLSEGAISLILVHGDRGYSAAASKAAKTLVRCHLSKYEAGDQSRSRR